MILPLNTGTIRAIAYGIVAVSPKGIVLFHGKMKAKISVIGTKINELERTAWLPTANAESIPTFNSLSGKRFFTNSFAASEIGVNPSIRNETIFGIKYITAAVVIPTFKV